MAYDDAWRWIGGPCTDQGTLDVTLLLETLYHQVCTILQLWQFLHVLFVS